ncbi:MAG: PEGA domain-containing protein [Polyangiaceae bacterium]|nr:PEGA domain-containing protein [Polyangiaceae bacterium]
MAARLAVRATESNASVQVDGVAFSHGETLPAGKHVVRVTRHGFLPWQREVHLQAGRSTELEASLVPTDETRGEYESRAGARRTWALAAAGAGVALGAATFAVYLWNHNRFGDWEEEHDALDEAYENSRGEDLGKLDRRQAENNELLDSIHTADTVTVLLGLTGGVLAATGAVLHFTGPDPKRYPVAAAVGSGSAWATGTLRF